MRRQVVIDDSGRILATGPHPEDVEPSDVDGPQYRGFIPKEGQHVHSVEFPENASNDQIRKMHATHRVRVEGDRAYLESA